MSQPGNNKNKRISAGIALLGLIALVVIVTVTTPTKSSPTLTSSVSVASSAQTNSTNGSSSLGGSYKNGTYSATGRYYSPGGQESINVSVTLSNDVVIASSAVSGANDPTATSYQTLFISGYKSKVIGKKIDSIKLSNVSGSSLTSQGFNSALKQIENQAKS